MLKCFNLEKYKFIKTPLIYTAYKYTTLYEERKRDRTGEENVSSLHQIKNCCDDERVEVN